MFQKEKLPQTAHKMFIVLTFSEKLSRSWSFSSTFLFIFPLRFSSSFSIFTFFLFQFSTSSLERDAMLAYWALTLSMISSMSSDRLLSSRTTTVLFWIWDSSSLISCSGGIGGGRSEHDGFNKLRHVSPASAWNCSASRSWPHRIRLGGSPVSPSGPPAPAPRPPPSGGPCPRPVGEDGGEISHEENYPDLMLDLVAQCVRFSSTLWSERVLQE